MTFLGIGPGELFLVLIILLVVVGPERLPGFARQAGKMLVGLRNWIQRSPDAQLFLRARDELEAELRTIRDDLAQEMESVRVEMQNVREEMIQATREATVDAAKQLDQASQTTQEAVQAATQISQAAQQIDRAAEQIEQVAQAVQEVPALAADEVQQAVTAAVEQAEAAEVTISQVNIDPQPPLAETVIDEAAQVIDPRPPLKVHTPINMPNGQAPTPIARSSKPYAPPQAPDPLRAEVNTLKDQLESLTEQIRDLQTQLRDIQASRIQPEPVETPHSQEVA